MIAAAYARYSTSNQQETSIAAQLEGIQAYCDREGIILAGAGATLFTLSIDRAMIA